MRDHFQPDHHPRSRQTDRSNALTAHLRQARKRVLAERALARNTLIAALLSGAQRSPDLALALYAVAVAGVAKIGIVELDKAVQAPARVKVVVA